MNKHSSCCPQHICMTYVDHVSFLAHLIQHQHAVALTFHNTEVIGSAKIKITHNNDNNGILYKYMTIHVYAHMHYLPYHYPC